jgi:hypothetical protein
MIDDCSAFDDEIEMPSHSAGLLERCSRFPVPIIP